MKIRLNEITIDNFRGIKSLVLKLDGQDVIVYGKNGTGKTTIAEAIHYLLFNQAVNEKSIDIVPRDVYNVEQKELTPTVKAVFDIDGATHTLERKSVYNKSTNGRSTQQYIDAVDKSVKDYTTFIEETFLGVNEFKLLTNPSAFFQLHWLERREIITSLVADITDEQIINESSEFKNVPSILGTNTVDDKKSILKRSIKQVKDDIKAIPIKIEENLQNIVQVDTNYEELEKKSVLKRIEEVEEKIIQLKNGNGATILKNEIASKQTELSILKNKLENANHSKTLGKSDEVRMIQGDIDSLNREINFDIQAIKRMEVERKNLLSEYHETKERANECSMKVFEFEPKTHCECCTQDIPQHLQDTVKEKELEKFNLDKSNELERFNNKLNDLIKKGKSAKEDIERTQETVQIKQEKLKECQKSLEVKQGELERLKGSLPSSNEDVEKLEDEIKELELQLENADDNSELITKLNNELYELNQTNVEHARLVSQIQRNDELQKRVETLKLDEESLQAKLDDYEEQKDLLDLFTERKMQKFSESINEKFDYIQIKLFDEKKNGELEEACEITVDGVEYNNGLNTAAQINAGLDVINTLSEKYRVHAPIFIDNSESVNDVIETDSQQILLQVSNLKKHEKLEMQIKGDK